MREHIRNFCIIAHIDHGKSTLADRFIQRAHVVSDREFHDRLLDSMEIERERGITIKSQAISLPHQHDGTRYLLNLVDTPGHVDFTYEVSRVISACEGALLLVDATQGVEAQTLANYYLALEHDLEVIPVINKVDLAAADIDRTRGQIERDLGLDGEDAVLVSAKTGQGIDRLLEAIVARVPPPDGDPQAPLQALVFDSAYDPYRGVVVHLRVVSGQIVPNARIRFWAGDDATYRVEELGLFGIKPRPADVLNAGEVGYLVAGIRSVGQARVGNTITEAERPCQAPLPGFREAKPVVFAAIYPMDADQYEELAAGLERLQLNDSTLSFAKESSVALGFGFRCGFLGLLHLEVVQERLEREFGLGVVLTSPSVEYRMQLQDGSELSVHTPGEYPDPGSIEGTQEPYVRASIITPSEYVGAVITTCLERRGIQQSLNYLDETRMELRFDLPLAEIVTDFYDRLKSVTRGYASFDYEVADYRDTDIVRLDVLLNGQPVDALAQLVFRGSAVRRAREVCRRLRDEIPRHQFKIPVQGAIGGQIIARETINAYRKDVTAKLYGGDVTRKRKLLEKQKAGKKRMKAVGAVQIPKDAFVAVLRGADA